MSENSDDKNKFCDDKIIRATLETLRDSLKKENEIFLSEADLQFSFAQYAKENGAKDIILEYPILTSTLYEKREEIKNAIIANYPANCKNKLGKYSKDRTYIDLFFKDKENTEYFIEFKYKLHEIKEYVTRHSEEKKFTIKSQLANNIGRYQVYEDIERMESIKSADSKRKSYVIFITNDKAYWETNTKKGKRTDFNFQLKDGEKTSLEDNGLEYTSTKNSRRTLYTKEQYIINWKPFYPKNKMDKYPEFKALIIDLQKPVQDSK